ncbi:hypothetical protein SAMN04487787_10922 [Kosakonia sacchari]|nr:hypothetical protein SAMN04487787_10922 [Kosakonia sacchari]
MNVMKLDFCTGALSIGNNELNIDGYDKFIASDLFKNNTQLKKWGRFYFILPEVSWLGGGFYLEIRPSVNNIPPCIYMIDRDSNFFQSLNDWNKRADLSMIKKEESRLIQWMRDHIKGGNERAVTNPPYGVEWVYEWGTISVQCNTHTFDCGTYITWNDAKGVISK